MQNLVAKHGKTVVAGGPLKGSTFDSISPERLQKVDKRYSGDPALVKFARAYGILSELEVGEPAPCVPVVPKAATDPNLNNRHWVVEFIVKTFKWMWLRFFWVKWLLLLGTLGFLLRPSVSTVVAKVVVTMSRLAVRRIVNLVAMILEGLLAELILQMDRLSREVLPERIDVPEVAQASFNLVSHIFSGCFGGMVTLLALTRRQPIQAWHRLWDVAASFFAAPPPPLLSPSGGIGVPIIQIWLECTLRLLVCVSNPRQCIRWSVVAWNGCLRQHTKPAWRLFACEKRVSAVLSSALS